MKEKLKIKFLKKKKSEGYFIALLKTNDIIFASWKIDDSKWKKKIEKAESGKEKGAYLYIHLQTLEDSGYVIIESIPVFGVENNWHIFLKNDYSGRKVVLKLCFRDKKGIYSDIMQSTVIDIPVTMTEQYKFSMGEREKKLFDLSGVNVFQRSISSW